MAQLVPFVGPALGLATGATNAFNFFRKLADVPEDGYFLWQQLEATKPAFELCTLLFARHKTMPYMEAAVALTNHTLLRCEQLLRRDDDEEDGRPDSITGWTEWLMHQKNGVMRKEMLPMLSQRLGLCQQALQLALASASMRYPGVSPTDPIEILPDAMTKAHDIIFGFECERVEEVRIALGGLYVMKQTPQKGQTWSYFEDVGDVEVFLCMGPGGSNDLRLRFEEVEVMGLNYGDDGDSDSEDSEASDYDTADDVDSDDAEATCNMYIIPLTSKTSFRRINLTASGDFHVKEVHQGLYGYSFGWGDQSLVFQFGSVPRGVSLETFEALIYMAKRKDGSRPLSEVLDIDNIPKLVSLMARDVGVYVSVGGGHRDPRDSAMESLTADLSRLSTHTPSTHTPGRGKSKDTQTPGRAKSSDLRNAPPSPSTPLRSSQQEVVICIQSNSKVHVTHSVCCTSIGQK